MLNLEDLEIEYRFSPRRRSIGLTVTAEGKLVVAAPRGTSKAHLARAVARHRDWIEQKATERREAWARLQEGTVYFLGRLYRLTTANHGREPVVLQDGEIRVQPGAAGSLWPALRAWLEQRADAHIQDRVAHYAPEMGVKARLRRDAGVAAALGRMPPRPGPPALQLAPDHAAAYDYRLRGGARTGAPAGPGP